MARAIRHALLVAVAALGFGAPTPERARAQVPAQSTGEDVGHGLPACDCQHLDILLRRMKTTARMAKVFLQVTEIALGCEQNRSQCGNLDPDALKQKLNELHGGRLLRLVEGRSVRELTEQVVRRAFLGGGAEQALTESPGGAAAPATSDPNGVLTGTDRPSERPAAAGTPGTIEFVPHGATIQEAGIWIVNGQVWPANRTLPPDRIPNDFVTESPADGYVRRPDLAARERAYAAWQRAHGASKQLCAWSNRSEAINLLRQQAMAEHWCADMARDVMEHERKHMDQCKAGHYWGYVNAPASAAAATEAEAYELETYKLQTQILQLLERKGHFTLAGSTTITSQHPPAVYKFAITTQATTKQKLQYHPPEERIPPALRLEFQSPMDITIVRPVTEYGGNCRLVDFPSTLPQKTTHAIHLYKDEFLRFIGQLVSETLIYHLACPTTHGTIVRHRIQPGGAVPRTGADQELTNLDGARIPIRDSDAQPSDQNFYFFTAQCRQ